jgi:sugar phosphate isomerase/epimerase
MNNRASVYIASVLLEKNRWGSRTPSFKVSDWSLRFAEGGFDGIELWENHLLLADPAEREAVRNGPLPVKVLNTYCAFDAAGRDGRSASAELARYLDVPAVKFNFGNAREKIPEYIDNLASWIDELPAGCRLLCECHPDTVLEEPGRTARILSAFHGRVEIIVHAFSGGDDVLRQWLEQFGSAVTHVHAVLREKNLVPHRIDILKKAGFSGTWSIEFCEGVGLPTEEMDTLLAAAERDLHYLRKELA